MTRQTDELAAEVDHVPCPTCQAQPGRPCVNRITKQTARVPCIKRIRAAEEVAAVDPQGPGNTVTLPQEATDR